jgi:hypothetical protein
VLLLGPRQTGKARLVAGDVPRRVDGIDVRPWQDGLEVMGL